jgi:hypothetical protein
MPPVCTGGAGATSERRDVLDQAAADELAESAPFDPHTSASNAPPVNGLSIRNP